MAQWVAVLRVEADFIRITLSAPASVRRPSVAAGEVSASSDSSAVRVWTESGSTENFGLWEQTGYQLVVEPLNGQQARVSSRSPSVTSPVAEAGQSGILTGILNLGSAIGSLTLAFSAGESRLDLLLEVFPSKIDYQSDYREILSDISRHNRNLLLRYLSETNRRTSTTDDHESSEIDFVTILRNEMKVITTGISLAESRPILNFVGQIEHLPVHRVKHPSATTITSILRQRGRGSWIEVGTHPVRERIPVDARVPSLDSPEHRWLQGQFQLVDIELARVESSLRLSRGVGRMTDSPVDPDVASTILTELETMRKRVQDLRRSRLLTSSSPSNAMVRPTTAIMTRLGYGQVFRSLKLLRHSLAVFGDQLNAGVSRLASLYEQWCFLEVVNGISSLLGDEYDRPDYFSTTQILLSNSLDSAAPVVFRNDARVVTVHYNRTIATQTGRQRPDILISISAPDMPTKKLVLDAKYRLAPPIKSDGVWTPGSDAIDAMHRYRDAITDSHDGAHFRTVSQAIALYPATLDQSRSYATSTLFRSINTVGVGALPFLPSNRALFDRWLESALYSAGLVDRPDVG